VAERAGGCYRSVDTIIVDAGQSFYFHVVEFIIIVVCAVGESFAIHAAADDYRAG
jgi:hypothetical protein